MLELFNKKGLRVPIPKVTIFSAGYLKLNSACMEKYFKDVKYVQLFYNHNKHLMGIKPTSANNLGAFKLTRGGDKLSASIAGRSFFNYYSLNFSKNIAFSPIWNKRYKMLIVSLKKRLRKKPPKKQ